MSRKLIWFLVLLIPATGLAQECSCSLRNPGAQRHFHQPERKSDQRKDRAFIR